MAKIRIPSRRSKRFKGYRTQGAPRTISAKVQFYRTPQAGAGGQFLACASVKGRKMRRLLTFHVVPGAKHEAANRACASGRNPRLAAGRALAKLGRALAHRTGAFHGL